MPDGICGRGSGAFLSGNPLQRDTWIHCVSNPLGSFVQAYELLKHKNMHQGRLARWVLLGSMLITYGIRIPATVAMSLMTVRDLILGVLPETAPWLQARPRGPAGKNSCHGLVSSKNGARRLAALGRLPRLRLYT